MFPRLKPTKNAEAQMLKTIEGAALRFSRIGLGNGERPSIDFEDITQMQNLVCFGNLTSYERNGTNAIIHWQLDCASVENAFDWTEYALFALDENDNEFLFSYAYNEGTPQPISSVNSDSFVTLENDINICIGDAENVSAVIGEYSAYASKEVVNDHIDNTNNPHKVTKKQVGLGNVENVSINDATPTFTEAKNNNNISSGDTTSTLWGKAKKLFSVLITHVSNKNNPHKVTSDDVGAAKKAHNHSTTDINSGILSIARGGTGVNSIDDLKKSLNKDIVTDFRSTTYLSNNVYNNYDDGYWKQNGTAYIFFSGRISVDIINNQSVLIMQLPSELRPIANISFIGQTNLQTGTPTISIRICTDGNVWTNSFGYQNLPSGTFIRFNAVYPTN